MKTLEKNPSAYTFDKYDLYSRAVQQPEEDVKLFREFYRELKGGEAEVLREDFCGTFQICCEWARLGGDFTAYGLDLDPEPIAYGRRHGFARLSLDEKSRVHISLKNVLDTDRAIRRGSAASKRRWKAADVPKADIVAALNFSYFIFKERVQLRTYLAQCLRSLNPGGLALLDIFGGGETQSPNEEITKHEGFTYYWDQKTFDPVTHQVRFGIHLKPDGGRKVRDCFTYDWRLWSIPEVRELMREAGFRRTHVYWEGTDGEEGNGVFTRTETGEDCECWIAYVIGEK